MFCRSCFCSLGRRNDAPEIVNTPVEKIVSDIDSPSLQLDAGPADTEITQETGMCSGNAGCFTGIVTNVIDGDTIKVDGQPIRFAL